MPTRIVQFDVVSCAIFDLLINSTIAGQSGSGQITRRGDLRSAPCPDARRRLFSRFDTDAELQILTSTSDLAVLLEQ